MAYTMPEGGGLNEQTKYDTYNVYTHEGSDMTYTMSKDGGSG